MSKWEYTVVKSEMDLAERLMELGTEGWELVSVTVKRERIPRKYFGDEDKDIDYQIAYLKRELEAA